MPTSSGQSVSGYGYTIAPCASGFAWEVFSRRRSVRGWCESHPAALAQARVMLAALRIDRSRRLWVVR